MITIHVNNSYSQIRDIPIPEFKELRDLLSYQDNIKSIYFSGGYPRTKYCIDNKGNFPTGLLYKVEKFLKLKNLPFDKVLNNLKVIPTVDHGYLDTMQPYDAQINAILAVNSTNRGTLALPTGSGKSLVIAMITAVLRVKTLIIVPNLEIKRQLTESFKTMFKTMRHITIENIDSNALKHAIDYDCLIIDEAHHVGAKTYHKLNKSVWQGIYYRFFLTATPFRNDPEEQLLFEGIAGQVIYQLTYKEAVNEGYIVPVEAYYIEIPKQKTNAYTWQQVYKELVINNDVRNTAIVSILNTLKNEHCLCLVKEIAHGEILANLSGVQFANGQNEDSRQFIRQFNEGKIKQLIGTQGIIGEGVDTKPCEYVIIAGLGKAKSSFMQQIGRAVRKYKNKQSAKIILILDKSHKFCARHFKTQCGILAEEYGVEPRRLE